MSEYRGWSFDGENLIISSGTVNTYSLSVDNAGNIFMSYLVDTDCDPFETGIGRIYVVNGSIVEYDTGYEVNWSEPILIEEFNEMDLGCQPEIAFINNSVGCSTSESKFFRLIFK